MQIDKKHVKLGQGGSRDLLLKFLKSETKGTRKQNHHYQNATTCMSQSNTDK